jgi:hypothetical protein
VRLAAASTENDAVAVWLYTLYTPVLELPEDNRCRQALFWYLELWLPDGEGLFLPIYSSNPSACARERIDTSESVRRIPEIWEKVWLDSQKAAEDENQHAANESDGGVI